MSNFQKCPERKRDHGSFLFPVTDSASDIKKKKKGKIIFFSVSKLKKNISDINEYIYDAVLRSDRTSQICQIEIKTLRTVCTLFISILK